MNRIDIETELCKLIKKINTDQEKQKELLPLVEFMNKRLKEFKAYFQICNLYEYLDKCFTSFVVLNNMSNEYNKMLNKLKKETDTWKCLNLMHECEIFKSYKTIIPTVFNELENILCNIEQELHKSSNNNTEIYKQLFIVLLLICDISGLLNNTEKYFLTKDLIKTFTYIQETLDMFNAMTNIMLDICERKSNNIGRLKVGEL